MRRSPALVIADEPTTALDVMTQQQILDLLRGLAAEFGLSMLFITHDLGVVAELCDKICVIYAGQTVETGPTAGVLAAPQHPYTRPCLPAIRIVRTPSSAYPAPYLRPCNRGPAAAFPRAAPRRVPSADSAGRVWRVSARTA